MPSTIKLKRGSGAPTAGQLVEGEVALDLTNKRIYSEDSGGTVLEMGINPTSLTTPTINNSTGVSLQYNGSTKAATTSTGIDVTGTVTADGLTVDGDTTIGSGGSGAANTLLSLNGSDIGTYGTVIQGKRNGTPQYILGDISGIVGSGNGMANWVYNSNPYYVYTGNSKSLEIAGNGDISFYEDTGTTAKFFWDASAERLGLGTTTPATDLHIVNSGAAQFLLQAGAADTCYFLMGDAADTNIGWIAYDNSSDSMNFRTNNAERMRIDSSGNVGINTTNVTNLLTIGLDSFATGAADTSGMYTDSTTKFLTMLSDGYTWNTRGGTERARIDSSGNLLVGTTSAGTKVSNHLIQVGPSSGGGQINISGGYTADAALNVRDLSSNLASFFSGATKVGSITTNGTTTAYNITSDERLKENIVDTTHTVDINDIKVRQYDWKANGEHQRYGFVAQELESVYPEAVFSPEDPDDMKSVDYSKLVPLLVKEIQDLKAEVAALKGA